MQVTLEQSETLCSLRLEGEMSIASAAEVKAALLRGLACGTELSVDLAGATALDVTALQLLWAAEREARRSGHLFTLAGGVPEEILLAVLEAGFEQFPIGSRNQQPDSDLNAGHGASPNHYDR
jgi:anti-sigma B factor antagonist